MPDDIKLPEPVAHLIERHAFRASPHGQDAEGRDWLEVVDRPEDGSFGVYTADQVRAAVEAELARRVPLTDTAAPKNCRQVPPGNGLCDRCASGYPELCRYIPAPKGGSDA